MGQPVRDDELFRKEALEAYRMGYPSPKAIEQGVPPWVRWSFWLVLTAVLAGMAAVCLVRIPLQIIGLASVDLQGDTAPAVRVTFPAWCRNEVRPGMMVSIRWQEDEAETHWIVATVGEPPSTRPDRQVTVSVRPIAGEPNSPSPRSQLGTATAKVAPRILSALLPGFSKKGGGS